MKEQRSNNLINNQQHLGEDKIILENYLQEIAEIRRKNPNKAIAIANEALDLAIKINDKNSECRLHNYIGGISLQKGNLDLGKQHLFDALDLYNTYCTDLDLLARIKLSIGSYYFDISDFENALIYFLETLKFNILTLKPAIFNNIASVHLSLGNYDEAFKYLYEGLQISDELQDSDRKIFFLYNLGFAHHYRKDYGKAISYYHQTASLIELIGGYQYMQCLCLTHIGVVNCDLGSYKKCLDYFEKAVEVSIEHDLFREHSRILRRIGEVKLKQDDIPAFFDYHKKSIQKANEHDLTREIMDSYDNLKNYYRDILNFEKAFEYAEMINKLQWNYFSKERDNKIASIVSEKKHEVELLEKKNEHIASQNEILEQTNKMLEEFAYVVAHDLREPIRSIISFTNLLERRNKGVLGEDSLSYMNYITNNAKHMNALLSDLLEYTTIEHINRNKEELDMNTIVNQVIDILNTSIVESQAEITITNTLPKVSINETHSKQLFQQLIHNAIKFRRSDVPCKVEISAMEDDGFYRFKVSDNGIGINGDFRSKIFKIFNRLDKKNYNGTGIGLSICQKIVQIYGGKIWVRSKVNEGTTFFFTFPKIADEEENN